MKVIKTSRMFTLLLQSVALLTGTIVVCSLTILIVILGLERALLIGVAFSALIVLLLPTFLIKRYDIFQPLTFAILSVSIGVTGRTLYVVLSSSERVAWLLLGKSPEFLLTAASVITVGLASYVLGYISPFPKLPIGKLKIAKVDRWSPHRLVAVVLVFTLVSIVFTIIFLRETGFTLQDLNVYNISSKRFVLLSQGGSIEYTSLGYLRWGASLSQIAFLLLFTWFVRSKRPWISLYGLFLLIIFVIAAFFPFVTSARGSLLFLVISSLIIWHYLKSPISLRTMLAIVVIAFVTLSTMLSLRHKEENFWKALYPTFVVEHIFGTRDFMDITIMAFIMDALRKGRLEYSYGSTYFTWLYAPIPRTMWPEKPAINPGWEINRKVFGFTGPGGPLPGMIGEAYWALGIPGVLIIPFLIGGLMGLLYRSFHPYLASNANMVVIYAAIIAPISLKIVGGDWSGTMVKLLQDLIPLLFALYFVTMQPLNQYQRKRGNRGTGV